MITVSVPEPSGRARIGPVGLFITVATVVVVAGLALWMVQEEAGMDIPSVSMALANYSEAWGRLPYPAAPMEPLDASKETGPPDGAGRPLYSWRAALVVFLESWHGAWDRSQPWNHPSNKELGYFCYFYTYGPPRGKVRPPTFSETNLVAVTGPGTAFGDGTRPPMALKDVPPQTIIVVETRSSGVPWPAPGDFDVRTMPRTINAPDGKGVSSRNKGRFHVIFADGRTWALSDAVPFETLKLFFTIEEAGKHDRERLLGRYALRRGPELGMKTQELKTPDARVSFLS